MEGVPVVRVELFATEELGEGPVGIGFDVLLVEMPPVPELGR